MVPTITKPSREVPDLIIIEYTPLIIDYLYDKYIYIYIYIYKYIYILYIQS